MRQRGVYERVLGSGIWWVRYADAMGRIRREKAGTKSAALQLYRKRKTEVLQGKKLPENLRTPVVLFAELAKDALDYSKAHKRSYPDDLQRMERILERFRNCAADSITADQIERFLEEGIELRSKRGGNWAPATINHYRSLMSLTYRIAIRNKKAATNPARATQYRKEDNSRVRFLSADEETKLRKAITEKWPGHIPELDLALNTGMRRSEMYGLTWGNVNLAGRILTVPRSKNGERRYVRLNSAAIAALVAFAGRGSGSGHVIRNLAGEPLVGPRYWFDKAIEKAEIEDFHWHDLRHTFASRLTMAGVSLRAVQEVLGHKSISMTVRYSHLSPDYQLDAVERLNVYNAPENASNASNGERTAILQEGATDTTTDTGHQARIEVKTAFIQ